MFAELGNIAAEGQQVAAAGHDMVGGDIILHLQQHLAGKAVRQRVCLGEGLDIGAADDLHGSGFFRRSRGKNHIVMHRKVLRHFHRQVGVRLTGIG